MAGLEVEGLGFRVGTRDILSDLSLRVAAGETIALLGPSGSGKTTLLRLVAGLDAPAAGQVRFDGHDVTHVPAHRRGFGLMFQDHALFPHLSVAKNVAFGLRNASTAGRSERVAALLTLVGLAGFEQRSIDKLSGGERQRVALARALAPSPKLLMLDEPLASLDRALRKRLVGEIREILDRLGIPAIYVTHDQEEAFALSDRIAILDEGRLVREGSPREVWAEPGTEFVARFLGLENIVSGTRDAGGMVATPVGAFGPLPGPPGELRILLRGEDARLAEGPGPNTAGGTVRTAAFRGTTVVIELERDGVELSFELPASVAVPADGQEAWVAVAGAQELQG